jgi:hypothetical protein
VPALAEKGIALFRYTGIISVILVMRHPIDAARSHATGAAKGIEPTIGGHEE